jgi:hypothetical protein
MGTFGAPLITPPDSGAYGRGYSMPAPAGLDRRAFEAINYRGRTQLRSRRIER